MGLKTMFAGSRQLSLLLTSVFAYALAFHMATPLLAYVVARLDASPSALARVQSATAVLQTVGSLWVGAAADSWGPRVLLVMAHGASALVFAGQAAAGSMAALYAALLPSVLQHGVLAGRAFVARHAAAEVEARGGTGAAASTSGSAVATRTSTLIGYVTLAFACGALLGPTIGGSLARARNPASTAVLASVVSAAAAVVTSLLVKPVSLPRALPLKAPASPSSPASPASDASPTAPHGVNTRPAAPQLRSVLEAARAPGVGSALAVRGFLSLSGSVFQAAFPMMLLLAFGLDELQSGWMMSIAGVAMAATQAKGIALALRAWGAERTIRRALLAVTVANLGLCMVHTPAQFAGLLVPMVAAASLVATATAGRMTLLGGPMRAGAVTSLDMALRSFCRVVAPPIAASVFEAFGVAGVGSVCAAFTIIAAGVHLLLSGGRQEDTLSSVP